MMFDDFFGFPRGQRSYAPPARRPTRQQQYYDDEDDDDSYHYAPPQRQPAVRRTYEEDELPELELEAYPGKGWTASAQLSRGLNSNNIKLQLVEGEDGEPFFLINAIGQRSGYYRQPTQTPLARCPIPAGGDAENTSAVVKNGVLTLMIPKKRTAPVVHNVPINRQPVQKQQQEQKHTQQQQRTQPQNQQKTRIPVNSRANATQSPTPIHATSSSLSPMTARRLQIANEEEDVFERTLKYAVPE